MVACKKFIVQRARIFPFAKIRVFQQCHVNPRDETSAALRAMSWSYTKVSSCRDPWIAKTGLGELHPTEEILVGG